MNDLGAFIALYFVGDMPYIAGGVIALISLILILSLFREFLKEE